MKLLLLILIPLFLGTSKKEAKEVQDFKIYVFVAETCPICQYYTKKIQEIGDKYPQEIVLVFPNPLSTEESIEKYKKKYNLKFSHILDKDHQWVKKLNADVTPEVFLYDSEQDSIYYRGRIDDTYYRVGKRRNTVRSDDLVNALNSYQKGEKIEIVQTQAVGCFITKRKENEN